MSLTTKDYKSALDILGAVYSTPDPNALFRAVCKKLQQLSIIYSAIYVPADPKTKKFYSNGYEVFNNHEGGLLLYLDHYAKLDPFVISGWWYKEQGENHVARNMDLVPKQDFIKGEFANDFLRPLDSILYCLSASLVSQGDFVGICGFHRQRKMGDFTDDHKKLIDILLPHIANAIRNLHLTKKMELSKLPHGLIAVDKDGKPFYMNELGKRVLNGASIEVLPDPGISSSPVFFKSRVGIFRVRTLPASTDRSIKVILLEQNVVRDPLDLSISGFHLSKRQNEVVAQVLKGLSNREIAEALHISEQTVKDHLYDIFGKLSVRSRSQLTALVQPGLVKGR